jgi:ABC-2 type transport system permease protein
MSNRSRAFIGAAQAEWRHLRRSPLLLALTLVQSVTFLVLVSLFGITGARAPTAVIDYDRGHYARMFIGCLQTAHHSFDLKLMDERRAMQLVRRGELVAMIVIPEDFSRSIEDRKETTIKVVVDNINTDMTEDIQRALPSAIVAFGHAARLPDVHVKPVEIDLIPHDTDFIPYLVVSALVSASLIISGTLAAVAVAHEFEAATSDILAVSPAGRMIPFLGRLLTTCTVSLVAIAATLAIVVFGYGIKPLYPIELAMALIACTVIFGLAGVALGAVARRTLPVASVVFGMALPLFLISGSYEPERFDGNLIWAIAHFSPVYYAVGIVEHAALGLHVTPEPVLLNFAALAAWASLWFVIASWSASRGLAR